MGKRPKPDPRQVHGVLVTDKPSGPTSTDCLNRIKRELGQPRIGHAGTLDPLASGVLVVLLGRATKIASVLTGADKTYRGTARLGLTTDTYDIQGTVTGETDPSGLVAEDVFAAVLDWKDAKVQEVPAYSAAKHKGRPLYALARAGEDVPVKTKSIDVTEASVLAMDLPQVTFRIRCSAGTYVRSLVHSLGSRLGCGATLTALVREQSAPFTLEAAHGLDQVLAEPETLPDRLVSLAEALAFLPGHRLTPETAARVKNGAQIAVRDLPGQARPGQTALFTDPDGEALALVKAENRGRDFVWAIERGLW
jgi:tRNA pseudouridine55 synthase